MSKNKNKGIVEELTDDNGNFANRYFYPSEVRKECESVKHSYEFLTEDENNVANALYARMSKQYKMGLISKLEADYFFQKQLMKELPKWAFHIYTNREEFTR